MRVVLVAAWAITVLAFPAAARRSSSRSLRRPRPSTARRRPELTSTPGPSACEQSTGV